MKEYKALKLTHLIDSNSGEPIVIYVPKDETHLYDKLSRQAFESGKAFRKALQVK